MSSRCTADDGLGIPALKRLFGGTDTDDPSNRKHASALVQSSQNPPQELSSNSRETGLLLPRHFQRGPRYAGRVEGEFKKRTVGSRRCVGYRMCLFELTCRRHEPNSMLKGARVCVGSGRARRRFFGQLLPTAHQISEVWHWDLLCESPLCRTLHTLCRKRGRTGRGIRFRPLPPLSTCRGWGCEGVRWGYSVQPGSLVRRRGDV